LREERNRLTAKTFGIAAAVETFVMIPDDSA
jgi:hypothetical protein